MEFLEGAVVVLGLTVSTLLGLSVVIILSLHGVRTVQTQRKQRAAKPVPTDSRHVGAALLFPAGVVGGIVVAGGSVLVCIVAAEIIAPAGVFFARIAVPPWQDSSHGPWVGGAMFITLAFLAVAVAMAVPLA